MRRVPHVGGSVVVECHCSQNLVKQNDGQCQGNFTAAALLALKGPDFDLVVFGAVLD